MQILFIFSFYTASAPSFPHAAYSVLGFICRKNSIPRLLSATLFVWIMLVSSVCAATVQPKLSLAGKAKQLIPSTLYSQAKYLSLLSVFFPLESSSPFLTLLIMNYALCALMKDKVPYPIKPYNSFTFPKPSSWNSILLTWLKVLHWSRITSCNRMLTKSKRIFCNYF